MSQIDEDTLMEICLEAGVTPDEITVDPEYGLCLKASAVRKLREHAPNQKAATWLKGVVDFVEAKPAAGTRVQ